MGQLPVFIITEMKWNWEHAAQMGLKVKLIKDDEGNVIDYEGNFIYVDRETLHTIEDVAAFIMDLQNEQKKGNLPYDLTFFWDSIGSIPCAMSVEKLKNNNEWNAGAMSTQFGNTSKIKAIKGGMQVEWGKRTNLQIDKNHVNGMQSRGKIVMTNHGFIQDTDKDKNEYKKVHADEWSKILGGGTFKIVEDQEDVTPVLYDSQDL